MTPGRLPRSAAIATIAALATPLLLAWGCAPAADPLAEARSAYARGDWAEAEEHARAAARLAPDDPGALRLLARASARSGRGEVAQRLYLRLGAEGAEAEDFFLLGSTLSGTQPEQAANLLGLALGRDPRHAEALAALGDLDERSDRLAEALGRAGRLAEVPGWRARGLVRLGRLQAALGEPGEAALAFAEALRLDRARDPLGVPEAAVRRDAARALLAAGRPAEARVVLAPAGPDPESAWLLGRAALQLGDRPAAVASAEAAAEGGYAPEGEPAPYVGAARCAECHAEIHRAQQGSRHARTIAPGPALADAGLPGGPIDDPDLEGVVHRIAPAEGGAGDEPGALRHRVEGGGEAREALIAFVLGSGRHARTPIGRDASGAWRELRLTHYASIEGWDRTPGQPARPDRFDDLLGVEQPDDALRRCLGCHTTHHRAALDPSRPESADRGIGCEQCHGPGGNHVAAMALEFPDPAIGRFTGEHTRQILDACGRCHGTAGRGVPEGDPFHALRFQAATMTWSRCYKESDGRLSCLSCHSAHGDAGRPASWYESRCLSCHGPGPQAAPEAGTAGGTACPVNPSRDCLSCHMPTIPSPMPHANFTDHFIRVRPPEPEGPSTAARP